MNQPTRRAARQLLEDWQRAGVTHLPRPRPAAPGAPVAAPPPAAARVAPDASPPTETDMPETKRKSAPAAPVSTPPAPAPAATAAPVERSVALKQLAGCVAQCVRCPELASTRTQTVFGVGNPHARVVFIGEAPGADEDRQGEPFVGKAGQLLNKIIEAMTLKREDLYICNILRCRPPGNRTPEPDEAANCREWLDGTLAVIRPEFIVCWGACAAQNLLGVKDAIGKLRGRFFQYQQARVLCTYHPSYLLRSPEMKKPVWEDMQILMKELGITPPKGKGAG